MSIMSLSANATRMMKTETLSETPNRYLRRLPRGHDWSPASSFGNSKTSRAKNDAMNDKGRKMMVTTVNTRMIVPCGFKLCFAS